MFRFLRLVLALSAHFVWVSCSTTGSPSEPHPTPAIILDVPRWEVDETAYEGLVPGSGSIQISLASQRLSLVNAAGKRVLETDCSTGKAGKESPTGTFRVLEKLKDKRSNKYGSYVSAATGEVMAARSWLVEKPAGSRFVGTPMPYWLRLNWAGVGIHVGNFEPGNRSSMGCIRVPAEAQRRLFEKANVGMRVRIY